MRNRILVYSEPPAEIGVLLPALHDTFGHQKDIEIKQVYLPDILQGDILRDGNSVLALAGAPDGNGYREQFGGQGFQNIQNAIEHHNLNMLGVCCFAYLACPDYDFQRPQEAREYHKSEISLIKARATGPIEELKDPNKAWGNGQWHNHEIADISFFDRNGVPQNAAIGYTLGPRLILDDESEHTIMARFEKVTERPPAVIATELGTGKLVLSAVSIDTRGETLRHQIMPINQHFQDALTFAETLAAREAGRDLLWDQVWDYLLER